MAGGLRGTERTQAGSRSVQVAAVAGKNGSPTARYVIKDECLFKGRRPGQLFPQTLSLCSFRLELGRSFVRIKNFADVAFFLRERVALLQHN